MSEITERFFFSSIFWRANVDTLFFSPLGCGFDTIFFAWGSIALPEFHFAHLGLHFTWAMLKIDSLNKLNLKLKKKYSFSIYSHKYIYIYKTDLYVKKPRKKNDEINFSKEKAQLFINCGCKKTQLTLIIHWPEADVGWV